MKPLLLFAAMFFACAGTLPSDQALASEPDAAAPSLQILWSMPIVADPPDPTEIGKIFYHHRGEGLVLLAAAATSAMQIAFLTDIFDPKTNHTALLPDVSEGPAGLENLDLKGAIADPPVASNAGSAIFGLKESNRTPSASHLITDGHGGLWIGGGTNYSMDIGSAVHTDAYLAKLDASGKTLWEHAYHSNAASWIADMAVMPDGILAVAMGGNQVTPARIVLIAAEDGRLLREFPLGIAKSVAITAASGNRLIVASIDPSGSGSTYRDDVSVRTMAADGRFGPPTILRPAISGTLPGAYYGSLRLSASKAGNTYAISSWEVPFEQNPALLKSAEIASVSPDGKLLWRSPLADSFVTNTDRGGATFCSSPAIATLLNDDALVACALHGQIRLHRFDRQTGTDKQSRLALPQCNDDSHPVSLFLLTQQDGTVLIAGSRPPGNVGPGCSWFGRLTAF